MVWAALPPRYGLPPAGQARCASMRTTAGAFRLSGHGVQPHGRARPHGKPHGVRACVLRKDVRFQGKAAQIFAEMRVYSISTERSLGSVDEVSASLADARKTRGYYSEVFTLCY